MSKTYRVMVVGMGKRGMHHASAFRVNKRFELVGLCDINAERLVAVAAKLGDPQTGKDALALGKAVKPDVFCFCTLPDLRVSMLQTAVATGARLIAFEKPIAMSSATGAEVKKIISANGGLAVVSHQHRYGVHYRKVKEIIAGGALGRVHTVYGTATGWMTHMLSHLIDYMRWYNAEAEAQWVMAQAAGRSKFADIHASPDYLAGFIQFANGVRGIVEVGAGAPDVPEVDYWWRKCRIGAQGTQGFAEVLTGGGWRAVTQQGVSMGEGCMNYDLDMPPYIQGIADWLDDPKQVHPCNFESAYKGFEITMALCRSAADGGQVALPLQGEGRNELDELRAKIRHEKVLLSSPVNAKEYGG